MDRLITTHYSDVSGSPPRCRSVRALPGFGRVGDFSVAPAGEPSTTSGRGWYQLCPPTWNEEQRRGSTVMWPSQPVELYKLTDSEQRGVGLVIERLVGADLVEHVRRRHLYRPRRAYRDHHPLGPLLGRSHGPNLLRTHGGGGSVSCLVRSSGFPKYMLHSWHPTGA